MAGIVCFVEADEAISKNKIMNFTRNNVKNKIKNGWIVRDNGNRLGVSSTPGQKGRPRAAGPQ